MKITIELSDAAAESSYLKLHKALPKLTSEEIEAGQKETGIAPLCRQNLDERVFILGLQVIVRELTNPGDTIASAIAKASDLTLVNRFLGALGTEVTKSQLAFAQRDVKIQHQGKALLIDEKFIALRKEIGDDAYLWKMESAMLAGLELALSVLGKTLEGEETKKLPPTNIMPARKPKKKSRRKR